MLSANKKRPEKDVKRYLDSESHLQSQARNWLKIKGGNGAVV